MFIGVDVHKDTHTAVGLSPFGEKVFEMTIGNEAEDFISLVEKTKVEANKTGLIPYFGLEDVHSWGNDYHHFSWKLDCLSERWLQYSLIIAVKKQHIQRKVILWMRKG